MTRADTTEELKKLMAESTPLPWSLTLDWDVTIWGNLANARFIVKTVNALPELLKAIDAMKAENERLKDALQELADGDFHASMSREIARTALTPEAAQ